jgi:chromate transport protein ChrA
MLLLATGYVAATVLPALRPAVQGLSAAVVGILLATTYRLARRNVALAEPLTVFIALAAFGAGAFLGVNAALLVVAGGLLGLLALRGPASGEAKRRGGAG